MTRWVVGALVALAVALVCVSPVSGVAVESAELSTTEDSTTETRHETSAGEPADGMPDRTDNESTAVVILAVLVGILVGGAGTVWYIVFRPQSDENTAAESTAERATSEPDEANSSAGEAAESAAQTETAETESTTDSPSNDSTAEPHRSDEDRVVELLETHGGQMKQAEIVEETEWSKSKVSVVLSEMEESGAISKLRIGRENIVSIAGQEPDAVGSPFDDE